MTGKTHIAGGFLGASICCPTITSAVLLIVGSILPDIDHGGSILGKNIPLLHKLFKHRGLTHSILFLLIFWQLNIYLTIGMAIHIILDMLTIKGVQLLWPYKLNVKFYPIANWIKTGSIIEKIIMCLLYIGAILIFVKRNAQEIPLL